MGSQLTKIIANFQTTLAANIAAGGTTGTLATGKDKESVTLPDGTYCMSVNVGLSNEQHMIFTLTGGTAMTNITGVSHNGTVTVGALKDARINDPIKLTDFANLLRIVNILDGIINLNGSSPLNYDASPSFTLPTQLVSKAYVDGILSGLVGTASDISFGTVKTTKNQGSKPRVDSVFVREQASPNMTFLVDSFKASFFDRIVNFAGGSSPAFIDPGLGGDLAMPTNNPANGETVVITVNGTACTFTFVTSIGSTPGNVLIGGNVNVSRANLAALINAPGVTTANGVAFAGAQLTAVGLINCTDNTTNNIFIRAVSSTVTSFSVVENLAGAGNTWTANTTKTRMDLLVLDSFNTLQIRKGSEAVSPSLPTPNAGDICLASVMNVVGQTTVKETTAALTGYITDWYDIAVYYGSMLFGGDGSDGDLTVSSGTTTLDLSVKSSWNWNNVTISAGATLTFSNGTSGTIVPVFKVKGSYNNAGTVTGVGLGVAGGTGGALVTNGTAGTQTAFPFVDGTLPAAGNFGIHGQSTALGGALASKNSGYFYPYALNGSGGGGGGGGKSADTGAGGVGGNGGAGGLGLYMEVAGNYTNSGTMTFRGANGVNGTNGTGNGSASWGGGGGGSGGGGGGGSFILRYKGTYSQTGTILVTGGTGGTATSSSNLGGGGGTPTYGGGGGGGSGGASSFNSSLAGNNGQPFSGNPSNPVGGAGSNGGDGIFFQEKVK